jgi:hypothetical protein
VAARVMWFPMPPEMRCVVEAALARVQHLLPSSVHELVVQYENDTGDGASLLCRVDPEYRKITLTVRPAWLNGAPAGREADLIHELSHVPLEPLSDLVRTLIDLYVTDEKVAKVLHEQRRRALEGATCDVSRMIEVANGTTPDGVHHQELLRR